MCQDPLNRVALSFGFESRTKNLPGRLAKLNETTDAAEVVSAALMLGVPSRLFPEENHPTYRIYHFARSIV